jgi:hypothetical protein
MASATQLALGLNPIEEDSESQGLEDFGRAGDRKGLLPR